ncbi:PLP-dependent transferase [Ophiobolus disseminans]|uniref:PLP-dependent transferase n=1 Tax=Ophiobolus disseminans TaxID=1469910 RepID=A0A6A7A8I3_9PLEO|nr:PLP-dependent transferase [Ophiobolus disseminans]
MARLRKVEYPMLRGITYLDHGGTTLASKSLIKLFGKEMQNTLLANPHSDASNPSASSLIVADARREVLLFFNANPDYFEVVFTANTTAAIKLVMECFVAHDEDFDYYYHRNCHTSLVGVREMAKRSHCLVSNEEAEEWIDGRHDPMEIPRENRPLLFAYPSQSNMSGERLTLTWPHQLRKSRPSSSVYTLLDVAAFVSTSPLDLSNHVTAPDFIALSFYKIFGFPDLGALIVRKASSHVLEHRKYFGGGTTEMITCFGDKPWVARKEASIHARLEDGTIAIRSILALPCAIDVHEKLFGSMTEVSKHTGYLAKGLYDRLSGLKHANGISLCHIYKAPESTYDDAATQGATIALNFRKCDGCWMGPYAIGAMLRAHNIHVRTGSFCNPAGMACALNLSPADIKKAYGDGFRCNQQDDIRQGGVLFGMVRVTFGAMSTLEDVERFVRFVEIQLVDQEHERQTEDISVRQTQRQIEIKEVPDRLGKPETSNGMAFPGCVTIFSSVCKAFLGCFPSAKR